MKNLVIIFCCFFLALAFSSCSNLNNSDVPVHISAKPFGTLPCGQGITRYTLVNSGGVRLQLMDFGAAITSVVVPDRNGKFDDIVLGYDNFNRYLCENPHFGGIVGRFGNRIANGRFKLDGVEYILNTNDNGQHLHGGIKGFDMVYWKGIPFTNKTGAGVKFTYFSKDGEENYPGNLKAVVTYTLNNFNEIIIEYLITVDKPTPVNLTQHGYWNLAGEGSNTILDHDIQINANYFIPTDKYAIPTGEIAPIINTPFDFTLPVSIGSKISENNQQLEFGKGYDHNWVLNKNGNRMTLACSVHDPKTGRVLEIFTTEPGLQFYSGNFLDGSIAGKSGKKYAFRSAIVLETQHFPDSPNKLNFPSTIVRPGQEYRSQTIYKFSTR